ncbi:MAG: amidohydrolase family protein [Desertimonas sp.]
MRNVEWLNQVREDIVDPEREICDPHHHLWDHPGSRYLLDDVLADLTGGTDVVDRDAAGASRHRVTSTVFVECAAMYRADATVAMAPIGETEFVQGIAAMSASGGYGPCRVAAGIVGFADLTRGPAVREVLDGHLGVAPTRFKGVRHAAGWDASDEVRNSHTRPDEHLMRRDDFHQGVGVLGELGLSFDAWCYHPQLADLVELARAHPEVTIVVDHLGGPLGIGPYAGRADEVFEIWQEAIAPLGALANVSCKLGGINMKLNGHGWHERATPPTSDELVDRTGRYYEHCLDVFGADRCMFESNFPVDRESVSYPVLWNAFKKLAASRTDAEQQSLFAGTAQRVYRLDDGSVGPAADALGPAGSAPR